MKKVVFLILILGSFISLSSTVANTQNTTKQTLAETVTQYSGQLPYSIKEKVENSDHIFISTTPSASGHSYISLNSLGKYKLCPDDIMGAIMIDPSPHFPLLDATSYHGQEIKLGNVYSLNINIKGYEFEKLGNPVKVTAIDKYYFTFSTLPGHFLQGSATHGIFRDSSGELWLFQEGRGVPNESKSLQEANYVIAKHLWEKMANNVHSFIENSAACGSNYISLQYTFKTNSYVNTGIPVKRGDKLTIRASGTVLLGPFAGYAGPAGKQYGITYNFYRDVNHGALIGEIGDTPFYIGTGTTKEIESSGILTLGLNDTDPGNNVGNLVIDVTLCKPAKRCN